MIAASTALHRRVQSFIGESTEGQPAEGFDQLACDLARFQAARIPALARLARARGLDVAALSLARDVPAVPTDVFKLTRVAVHPAATDVRVFRTSGTTVGRRGEHPLRDLSTYELGAAAHGRRMLLPDGVRCRVLVLGPTPEAAADSSLAFMCGLFGRAFCDEGALFYGPGPATSRETLARDLGATDLPVLLLGTSFAFVHLLDEPDGASLELPPGSRVMQTGGFKGRSREVDAPALLVAISDAFRVAPERVVSEYGMTELSSQAYEGAIRADLGYSPPLPRGVHVPPAWMRVTAVDSETLEELPEGTIGLARVVDLANVDSAVAVQTQDRVRVVQGGFELLGRAAGAPPRGCSLATEEMLGVGP